MGVGLAPVGEDTMELKRIGRQGLLLMMGLWASGCALVEQRADDAAWQGEPVLIGTVGDKQYQLKDLTVRPSHRVCDVAAYSAGFKNALVDRWDTNAMLDRLPKRLYFNVRPVNLRGFLATARTGSALRRASWWARPMATRQANGCTRSLSDATPAADNSRSC